jgi:hypothetical protein
MLLCVPARRFCIFGVNLEKAFGYGPITDESNFDLMGARVLR